MLGYSASTLICAGLKATVAAQAACSSAAGGAKDDVTVLQFALTLEKLEAEFYKKAIGACSSEGLAKVGFDDNQVRCCLFPPRWAPADLGLFAV